MEANLRENKMGTMKIPKLLFSISVPIIISMLVQALYNIVDSIFVARFDPDAGTGALTLAFPIQMLMIAAATGFGVGMNALLSRALGQKNKERADLSAGQGIFLTLFAYIVFLVFGLFIAEPFVAVQTEKGSLLYRYSIDYISVISIFSLGLFIQVTCERLLQATGKSVYSMITQLSGAITNIILDPILIFGFLGAPALGVKGAAIATVIGQAVSAIVGIILNLTINKEITVKLKNIIPRIKILGEMLAIGIPSVLMQAIGSVMTFSMNNILLKFSGAALNVFGIYFKLQSFIFMPVFGLNNGMIPIIAYNYGAEKKERIYATMKLSSITAIAYMLLGFSVFQLLPETLLGFFNASAEMIKVGIPSLRIISISFMLAGFSIVSISTCQALGKSIYSLIVSVIRQLVVLIPAAYLLSLSDNVNLVWWSFPIAEFVGCTCCIVFVNMVLKKTVGKPSDAKNNF
ncbi:MAG: MATE family efflux transporter [Ruminococcaceae bacterium]|nr:MATE family efflux transporter [Oscillospiraceae bacterium]